MRSVDPEQTAPATTPEAVVRDPEVSESSQAHPSAASVSLGAAAHATPPPRIMGEQVSTNVRTAAAGAVANVVYAGSSQGDTASPRPPQQSVLPAVDVRPVATREGGFAQPALAPTGTNQPAELYTGRIREGIPAEALTGSLRSGVSAVELPFEAVVGMSAVPLQQQQNSIRPADPADLRVVSGRNADADAEFIFPRGADVNTVLKEFAKVDRLRIMDGVHLPPFTIHNLPMTRPTSPVEPTAVTTAKRFPADPEGRYVL